MALSTGPFSGFLTACATAAGAGIVLFGLARAVLGLIAGADGDMEPEVRRAGYLGGVVGLATFVLDITLTAV